MRPIEALVPRGPHQRIVVIALNTVETLVNDGWKTSIPFAGYLLAMSYIGHAVLITEGHPSVLSTALMDASLLIVDRGMVPFLQPDWIDAAKRCGIKRVLIFGRDGSLQELVADSLGGNQAHAASAPAIRTEPASHPLPPPPRRPWWKFRFW